MHTPSPAAGTTPPWRRRPRRRWFTWPRVLHAAPVAVTALYGALWIAFHAGGGRGFGAHAVAEPGPHRNPAGPAAAPPRTSRRAGRHPGRLPAAGPRPAPAARGAGRVVHRRRHPPPHHHGPGRHRHGGSDHRDALS